MKQKNTFALLLIALTLMLTLPDTTYGQDKGKGGPPSWAPAHGYRAKTAHVYFPDHNFYFDVKRGVYIYLNGGGWQVGVSLPSKYAGINLNVATKIQLELDTPTPQKYNAEHIAKYKTKRNAGEKKAKPGQSAKGKKK